MKMSPTRPLLLSATLLLCIAPGCRKEKETETTTPDKADATTTSSGAVRPTLPAQTPAPDGLDGAIMTLLGGDAQAALDQLQPLFYGIDESDATLSARVAVAGWIVVGHGAVMLPENGEDLLESLQQWTSRLESADVAEATAARTVAQLSEGALHKAFGDFDAAIQSLRPVADAAGPWQAIGTLWLAEATLNSAYGDEGIERPEKIDAARPLYERALAMSNRDIVRGMANEGLAVVAELKRNGSEACEFAAAAVTAYEAAGANEFRLESPKITLEKNRCN